MKQRLFIPILYRYLMIAPLLLALSVTCARAAEGIEIVQARLLASDDGYKLGAHFEFDLNRGLEDALKHGVALYFTTEVELTRPRRWYWFDEKTSASAQSVRISYNMLTRQYRIASSGSLQQNFSSLDEALSLIRRPQTWVVAEKGSLKAGENYNVALRVRLDVSQLSKPFQINAINNADWRLSSDWKHFTYKVE